MNSTSNYTLRLTLGVIADRCNYPTHLAWFYLLNKGAEPRQRVRKFFGPARPLKRRGR